MSEPFAYSLRSLRHDYDGKIALDIPHLDIPQGRIWGLVGPNGSGKSTLLSILALLMKPASGTLHLDGIEATSDKTPQLRRKVTLVHQKPVLFSGKVRSNISYGLRVSGFSSRETAARVQAMMEETGLASFADRQARTLSGGEAQRVVLARGLVLRTPILLLDEPTNSLDESFRPVLLELLRKANASRGTTILVASHDADFVSSITDRIIRMESGKLFC
jgi:tungstate transport system ATP-binding protein